MYLGVDTAKYIGRIRHCQLTNQKGNTMKSRLYKVTELATNKLRIVEANNAAQAMKFVAETTHKCDVITSTSEAARLVAGGVAVESAVKTSEL
jgi:hypothetical protein